jgi:hypothetical protein
MGRIGREGGALPRRLAAAKRQHNGRESLTCRKPAVMVI